MSATHKIAPSNPRLASLLSDVAKGNIKIPVFQREYVWNDDQIMSLLDSIYHGYPVGSLLLWSTKESLKHERNVGGFVLPKTPEDYPVNYVLDGQQRLTTLYGVFNSDTQTSDAELAARFDVCFVPETEEFCHQSVAEHSKSINLRVILDTTKLLPELGRFSDADKTKIATLTERFKDYEFPVVTIKDRTNQEVCRVFQRINSSGTSLSTLELLSAWTWSDQFDLRNELGGLLDRLSDRGYEQLDETLLMRCLASIVLGKIDVDELVNAAPEKLIEGVATLKQAINATIDFLDKDLKIKNSVFIPFPIMLVPLVSFFSKTLKPTASQFESLRKWFWFCSFSQRYKAGTNALVMEDIQSMAKLAAGEAAFVALDSEVPEALFKKTWRINSTAAKATICLLAQLNPKTFLTGRPVDLGTTMAAYNSREFHHIYPKAFLSSQDIPFHQSNVIANICLLAAVDNKAISDKNPSDYFATIPFTEKDAIFESACIPKELGDGSKPYAEFLNLRARALADIAGKLIKNGHIS